MYPCLLVVITHPHHHPPHPYLLIYKAYDIPGNVQLKNQQFLHCQLCSYNATVQVNFNLTLACTIPACYPWILARDVRESFYFTCERTRTIQLLSNFFTSKFHKCESHHKYKRSSRHCSTRTLPYMPSIIYDFSNVVTPSKPHVLLPC